MAPKIEKIEEEEMNRESFDWMIDETIDLNIMIKIIWFLQSQEGLFWSKYSLIELLYLGFLKKNGLFWCLEFSLGWLQFFGQIEKFPTFLFDLFLHHKSPSCRSQPTSFFS